jgi:hypothetical protein
MSDEVIYIPIAIPSQYHNDRYQEYCIRAAEEYRGKLYNDKVIVDINPMFEYTEPIITASVPSDRFNKNTSDSIVIMMACHARMKSLRGQGELVEVVDFINNEAGQTIICKNNKQMSFSWPIMKSAAKPALEKGMRIPLVVREYTGTNFTSYVQCKSVLFREREYHMYHFRPLDNSEKEMIDKIHSDIQAITKNIMATKRHQYINEVIYMLKNDFSKSKDKTFVPITSTDLNGYYWNSPYTHILDQKITKCPDAELAKLRRYLVINISNAHAYMQMLLNHYDELKIFYDMCVYYEPDDTFNRHKPLWEYYEKCKIN